MGRKIKEVLLKVTEERVDEAQLLGLFENMINESDEHFREFGTSGFMERALRTRVYYPERFSRRFSLGFIDCNNYRKHEYPNSSIYLTVKCSSQIDERGGYHFCGFRLTLESMVNNRTARKISVFAACPGFIADWENDFHNFVAEIIKEIRQSAEGSDLLRAYLYQGFQKALLEIRREIEEAMFAALKKKDACELFSTASNFLQRLKEGETKATACKAENYYLESRVCRLENAIHGAVKEIEETKSITKSQTLADIRERLEAALKE